MCWWTENSRGQIQLAFNSCFSLKRSSFNQTLMKINFWVELLSFWKCSTPTSWGGNVEGTLTTSWNSLLPSSYVMYIWFPQDNQYHACQQYIKQSSPFFTLPSCAWSPTSFYLRIQQSAFSLYHECILCFCGPCPQRISKYFMYAHDSVDSIVFPGSKTN